MNNMRPKVEFNGPIRPRQLRAKRTYDRLLSASQEILAEDGYDALNSNAIAARAGMSPPSFYRYFSNKMDILSVLAERLMNEQNEVILAHNDKKLNSRQDIFDDTFASIHLTLDVTKEFIGSRVIFVLVRAIPQLRGIRTSSHDAMADFIGSNRFIAHTSRQKKDLVFRSRLAIEYGYSTIEMLFETDFRNQKVVIERAAHAITSIYDDLNLF